MISLSCIFMYMRKEHSAVEKTWCCLFIRSVGMATAYFCVYSVYKCVIYMIHYLVIDENGCINLTSSMA